MTQRATASAIFAVTWALGACGVTSPDADRSRATDAEPRLLVELQALPDGHPPVPGFSSPPTLPEGHPRVPGLRSAPALPEGHPRCPAPGLLETPPSDAWLEHVQQSPPQVIST